jgi:(p)ppGpp synthase/HD superfamily hydrolase
MFRTLEEIIEISRQAHLGQYRFDGVTPYFTHVEGVANSFSGGGITGTLQMVAYLHDVLEDTSLTAQALLGLGIHPSVVEAVVAITKVKDEDYFVYLARVKANDWAKRVKIADILYNLGDSPSRNQVKKYAKALKFLLEPL